MCKTFTKQNKSLRNQLYILRIKYVFYISRVSNKNLFCNEIGLVLIIEPQGYTHPR